MVLDYSETTYGRIIYDLYALRFNAVMLQGTSPFGHVVYSLVQNDYSALPGLGGSNLPFICVSTTCTHYDSGFGDAFEIGSITRFFEILSQFEQLRPVDESGVVCDLFNASDF